MPVPEDKANKENKRKLTYEELELALAESQQQYVTLTAYLRTVSEKLEREKALQAEQIEMFRIAADNWQKESDMWRREAKARSVVAKKRELEIEGLKWLILHPIPPMNKSKEQPDDDTASTETASIAPSIMHSNDSGVITEDAANKPTKGCRKRSTTISDFRPSSPKIRRPASTTNLSPSSSANGKLTGLGLGFGSDCSLSDVPYTKYVPDPTMSTSSSAASSTLSLITPPLTASNTVSSVSSGLSAIPESPSADSHSGPIADIEPGKDEKRLSRATHRTSSSSIASPLPAVASIAYANNLNTARGPSIEQVLESAPPSMEEYLEKLRPFGNS